MHAHSIAPHIYSVDHIVRTEVNIHPEVIVLTVTPDPSRIRIAFSCSVTVNYLEDMRYMMFYASLGGGRGEKTFASTLNRY